MSYDISPEERNRKGLDYDLTACLEYNPQSFTVEDIEKVLAVWEGENDGDDWRWIIHLTDGRFVFLQGGCDYTGWDCQSWATSEFATSAADAAKYADGSVKAGENGPQTAGLGHMLAILTGTYLDNANEVYRSLMYQLEHGKGTTWREKMDSEFGT